ncbi:MAG TPA: efflux RND transporter periplasmic adaptor subunit [Bacteroidales bacterium]|nr:efflux RND transporter periplasmic adaptor subunit [Bacteroidales bacterium]
MKYIKSISAVLICGLIITACSSKTGTETTASQNGTSAAKKADIPVKVMTIRKSIISRTIDYTATILPFEEVNMAPSVPGRIEKIFVEEGDRVEKGQDLILMDRTQLYQQKVQLASLEKDLARLDTLLKTGSVKQQQYDQLKTQYDVTKTNVDFMEENTFLKAPFNGIVTGKYFENGEIYSGSPTTSKGRAAIVTIMQVNPLKVNVNISEQYYPLIKRGMKAMITADVYKDENFSATVYRVAPTIDSDSRSFTVELELPNRNEMLKPGMFVRVSMNLGEVETFVVPASVVLSQEGTNTRYVFLEKDNMAERIEVTLGKRFDDKLEIISDNIREGDKLISEGQAKLVNGDKIEIIK